jgi:polar amino acid transport system substrate-binding protein
MLMVAMIGAVIATPTYSQTSVSPTASAQGETSTLRVSVFIAPPSVFQENGSLTGFSVDLWNAIAKQLKLTTIYQIEPDVGSLEEAMRSKRADLTLNLFITPARDASIDFSIPTMDAGLQILVPSNGGKAHRESPLWDMLRLIFSPMTLR